MEGRRWFWVLVEGASQAVDLCVVGCDHGAVGERPAGVPGDRFEIQILFLGGALGDLRGAVAEALLLGLACFLH